MNKKLSLLIAAAVMMVGCSQINKDNYQRLEAGMDFTEVETLLGTPSECEEVVGLKQCKWGNEQRYIDIKFVADKVTYHSMKGL